MTRRHDLHNNRGERTRRKATVDAWRSTHGAWCPGYGVPAHQAEDLTADHLLPVGAGGDPYGPLGVLCRACNTRKRDGRAQRLAGCCPLIRSRNWMCDRPVTDPCCPRTPGGGLIIAGEVA